MLELQCEIRRFGKKGKGYHDSFRYFYLLMLLRSSDEVRVDSSKVWERSKGMRGLSTNGFRIARSKECEFWSVITIHDYPS